LSADDDLNEIIRLGRALEVCAYVLARRKPTVAEIHAGQQASTAWFNEDWQPETVHKDIPNFMYAHEKLIAERE
jgi:hypothetical protein